MVLPVVQWERHLTTALKLPKVAPVVSLLYLLALTAVPTVLVGSAAALSRRVGGLKESTYRVAIRFSFALVPIGFGMWLAHYSFHLLTGWQAFAPATLRFLADHGWAFAGTPQWTCAGVQAGGWLLRMEILFLDLGLLTSLFAAYQIARTQASGLKQIVAVVLPWAGLLTLLFAFGVWTLLQPMQMRGLMGG
jgi:hypothetical protein